MSKLFVVGIGPGEPGAMTGTCRDVLERVDVIAGYSAYVALVRPLYPEKRFLETGMKREVERCRAALAHCADGDTVAMVCSGDAGVYGMAGLILELAPEYPGVEIDVVPGVTAALSGGALLGAPLGHDFAVISLSDLLTPWETIEKRLDLAAKADFCMCIYNPMSRHRPDTLRRACDLLLKTLSPETVCGVARNIGRGGEEATLMTLKELRDTRADMFSTAFVGNRMTRVIDGKMVTPRGYRE